MNGYGIGFWRMKTLEYKVKKTSDRIFNIQM